MSVIASDFVMDASSSSRCWQKKKRGKRNESASLADQRRTLPEWKKLARTVLVLKCHEYNLVTKGSQKQMAERLHNHFQTIRNNKLFNKDPGSIAQEEHDDQTLLINPPRNRESTPPSVGELASSLQSLMELAMGLVNAWEKTDVEKEPQAKRRRTVTVSSSTSSLETDRSESDLSSDKSSSVDDIQVEGNTKAASFKKPIHDRRTAKNMAAMTGVFLLLVTSLSVGRTPDRNRTFTIQVARRMQMVYLLCHSKL